MANRKEILALMQGDEFDGLGQLIQLGEEAVPVLLAILRDRKQPPYLRHRAVAVLGEIGVEAAGDEVEATLLDEDPVLRLGAIRALSKIRGASAAPALENLLKDEDTSVAKVAIQSLAEVGGEKSLDALEKLQRQGASEFLRAPMAEAIREIRSRQEK